MSKPFNPRILAPERDRSTLPLASGAVRGAVRGAVSPQPEVK